MGAPWLAVLSGCTVLQLPSLAFNCIFCGTLCCPKNPLQEPRQQVEGSRFLPLLCSKSQIFCPKSQTHGCLPPLGWLCRDLHLEFPLWLKLLLDHD